MPSVQRNGWEASWRARELGPGAHGERIGRIVGVDKPASLLLGGPRNVPFAVTRLVCEQLRGPVTASVAREDAYIFALELRESPAHVFWAEGREIQFTPRRRGQASLLDLNLGVGAHLEFPFDSLHLYVPRAALDAATDELGAPRVERLRAPLGPPVDDVVVRQLGEVLAGVLEAPERANRLFLDHVAMALHLHLVCAYGATAPARPFQRGGLSPLQERRVKELLLSRLDGDLAVEELAQVCGLSTSHFARAFKISVGQSPHRWLLAQRIERARALLLQSKLPLADIAVRTGFADQSHFTTAFVRAIGVSPGAWRRAQRT